jgi:DMSO/TMAO reductase YedYZ molybdopterin-dependent catalytic subunit
MSGAKRIPVMEQPFVAETPLSALTNALTPTPLIFVRSHFEVPVVDPASWRLAVGGAVGEPLEMGFDEILSLPTIRRIVTMECAGNGRTLMRPTPKGAAWSLGGASTVEFGGAPLRLILERARVSAAAVEILFSGADRGEVAPGRVVPFERSLPLEAAMGREPLLAWEMNGEPLTPEHGFPLRLVVPGWYSVASVKWLTGISALTRPFEGRFQTEEYLYVGEKGVPDREPLSTIRVRSLIGRPAEGEEIAQGPVEIAGTAWSGAAPIESVEVSVDGERTWLAADLAPAESPFGATPWRLAWRPPSRGRYVLAARATDRAGNTQPLEPVWNAQGYGNNVVQRVGITIT